MRKLATWLIVTLGVAALVRRLRRRATAPAPATPATPAADPADELRRRLAETRTESVASDAAPDATVSDRRAEVHDEGRAAIDEMRSRPTEE